MIQNHSQHRPNLHYIFKHVKVVFLFPMDTSKKKKSGMDPIGY